MRVFQTIEHGFDSGFKNSAQEVFRLSSEFEALWQSHSTIFSPPPNIPEVDFESDMVLGVFLGTQNSGGYDIEIKSIEENDSEISVKCETKGPLGGIVTCALTQPFHIVKISKSTKPVRFIITPAAPQPKPLPLFICCVDEKEKVTVANQVQSLDAVSKVDKLFGGTIINVKFNEDKIDKNAARQLLEGISGISSVEEDQVF
mmetsp:Transcript_36040/g.39833  ORF Transcript_36040/g.39833 Transcript_36040/m.39833 type:complete len:202 (-) Transcript_36040:101-706(-)